MERTHRTTTNQHQTSGPEAVFTTSLSQQGARNKRSSACHMATVTRRCRNAQSGNKLCQLDGAFRLTVPVDQGLDQLAAVQLVVVVGVVHLEVVELQLLLGHFAGVQRHLHVLGDVTGMV